MISCNDHSLNQVVVEVNFNKMQLFETTNKCKQIQLTIDATPDDDISFVEKIKYVCFSPKNYNLVSYWSNFGWLKTFNTARKRLVSKLRAFG